MPTDPSHSPRWLKLPVDEAVQVATAVAQALDFAHREGVVHRDIKPANILFQDGQPVVSDFGIALAVGAGGGARLTETGLSLGTPYYMSPEQATGDQQVGPRSDIFSLGCVLYEMLTGDPPYMGSTAQAVLGQIIAGGVVYARDQRPSIPANVDAAIRRALEKLPADRFASAKGLAEALAEPTFRHGERPSDFGRSWRLPFAATACSTLLLAVALVWNLTRTPQPQPTMQVAISIPEDQAIQGFFESSPDGTFMVYKGPGEATNEGNLWILRWDRMEATPIPGADGAVYASISPDSRSIAFSLNDTVHVLPTQGGIARSLGNGVPTGWPVGWGPEGEWIYYQHRKEMSLHRVRVDGGPVEVVARLGSFGNQDAWFDVMPDGLHILIELSHGGTPGIYVLDLESGEPTFLIPGRNPQYVDGTLYFVTVDGRTLMRAVFDPSSLELLDPGAPIVDGLQPPLAARPAGWAFYSASQNGTLLYGLGDAPDMEAELVWVNRNGDVESIDSGWTFHPGIDGSDRGLSLSPNGTQVALSRVDAERNSDIWLKEIPVGGSFPVASSPAMDFRPRWAPDGGTITFLSNRPLPGTSPYGVYAVPSSGTGEPSLLLRQGLGFGGAILEAIYSPDMEWLVGRSGGSGLGAGGRDLWAFRPGTDSVAAPLVANQNVDEKAISFAPGGRYILYESDRTGQNEIYVQPFPDVGEEIFPVSVGGGVMPVWSRNGDEIFYIDPNKNMMVAEVEREPKFRVLDRSPLFELPDDILFHPAEQYPIYDVSLDQRFLMFRVVTIGATENRLVLARNWPFAVEGG
jgi:Tol biopolymer transport system component